MLTRYGLPIDAALLHRSQHGPVGDRAGWTCELYRLNCGRLYMTQPSGTLREVDPDEARAWLESQGAHPDVLNEVRK